MNASSSSDLQLSPGFTVRFWGVRGSIPTPGLATARYGGNTVCIEVQVADKHLIFDGGTGLRMLGKHLLHDLPVQAHLFFSHTHWDRIHGFPFFIPAFLEGNQFDIYGSFGLNGASIKQRLSDQMLRPNFSTPLQTMRSQLQFHDITSGSTIKLGDVVVEAVLLNSANNALGYRVNWGDRSIVYALDTVAPAAPVFPPISPPNSPPISPHLLALADHTDLLIYDIAYTDHAYLTQGQPPQPWRTAVAAAIATQAQQTLLCHHDPDHEDDVLDALDADLQKHAQSVNCPPIRLAREGMILEIR